MDLDSWMWPDRPHLIDPGTGDDPFPLTIWTDDGLELVIDHDVENRACRHTRINAWVSCIMPKGHDTPHFGASHLLLAQVGQLVVTNARRIPR